MNLRRNEGAFNFLVKRISHLRDFSDSAMASDFEAATGGGGGYSTFFRNVRLQ